MKRLTWLSPADAPDWFPDPKSALDEPPGLLAAGGDLSARRLLAAYHRGIFPWYSEGQPVLWWSPDPREVLLPAEFRLARSLGKSIRNRGFEVTFDQDFDGVITACAAPRDSGGGTWITPEMASAYRRLHGLGHAHSIETRRDGQLVGGLYGVALGGFFFGESMFSRENEASKVALARLVAQCPERGIDVIDCQLASGHLRSLGSRAVSRAEFLALLERHGTRERPEHWT